jgi:hypothetical protein
MASTFKVGDKVKHETYGEVELAFGPVDFGSFTGGWLVKQEDGDYAVATSGALSSIAKFKVGDQTQGVRTGQNYTIDAGPFFDPSEWYVTRKENGDVTSTHARNMVAVESVADPIKVGDVIRIPRDNLQGADVKAGDLLVVSRVGAGVVRAHAAPGARQRTWVFAPRNVQKVDADSVTVHDGVVYDLAETYLDRDRDAWKLRRNPELRDEVQAQMTPIDQDEWRHYTLGSLVRSYGPLTRV